MWCKTRQFLSRLFLLSVLLLLSLGTFHPLPASATISTIEEAPGQILYQSRHKLKDNRGNTWQVVLFKRMKAGDSPGINLRLVAFPGTADLAHPQPLEIITATGKKFHAEDIFAQQAPANNVGQYNVKNILNQLPTSASIYLVLGIKNHQYLKIKIPPEVILEWQIIAVN